MRVPHVAITLESPKIVDAGELARVAAAIQRQVTRDFAPAWGIHATVDVFPRLDFTFRGRLCAHGGVPYLSELDASGDAAAHIVWAERPRGDAPGPNGFAMVRVEGGALLETFHDTVSSYVLWTNTAWALGSGSTSPMQNLTCNR
jgi:hypothetical protein